MIALFKQNSLAQVAILLLVTAALWTKAFIHPVGMVPGPYFSPLYDLVAGWLSDLPRLVTLLALLITMGEGIWLNLMLYNYKIIPSGTLFPMLFYLVLMSWGPEQTTLTPHHFVNIFVLLCAGQLLSNGATTLSTARNFNVAFCIGMAMLFHLPAVTYVLPFILIFFIYKMYRWRDIVVAFFGFVAPAIVMLTYAFLADKLDYYLFLIRYDLSSVRLTHGATAAWETVSQVALLLLLAVTFLSQAASSNDKTIHRRINNRVLTLPLLGAAGMMLYSRYYPVEPQSIVVPLAYLSTAYFMTEHRRMWIYNTLLILFLLIPILNIWIP